MLTCPKCGFLQKVLVEAKRIYRFDSKTRKYVFVDGVHKVYCPNCKTLVLVISKPKKGGDKNASNP